MVLQIDKFINLYDLISIVMHICLEICQDIWVPVNCVLLLVVFFGFLQRALFQSYFPIERPRIIFVFKSVTIIVLCLFGVPVNIVIMLIFLVPVNQIISIVLFVFFVRIVLVGWCIFVSLIIARLIVIARSADYLLASLIVIIVIILVFIRRRLIMLINTASIVILSIFIVLFIPGLFFQFIFGSCVFG